MKREFDVKGFIDTETGEIEYSHNLTIQKQLLLISLISVSLKNYAPKSRRKLIEDILKKIAKNPNKEFDKWKDAVMIDSLIYELENGELEDDDGLWDESYLDYEAMAEELKESTKEFEEEMEKEEAEEEEKEKGEQ